MYLVEVMTLTICSKKYISFFPSELQEIIIEYLFYNINYYSQKVYIHDIEDYSLYNQLNFHIHKEKIKENIYKEKLNHLIKSFYYIDPEDFIIEYTYNNYVSFKTNIEYDEEIKEKIITTKPSSHIIKFLLQKNHNTFVFFEKKLWDSILTPTLKKHIITKNIQNIYYYCNNDSLLYLKYKDQLDDFFFPYLSPEIKLISNMPIKQQQEVTDINFSISYDYEPSLRMSFPFG